MKTKIILIAGCLVILAGAIYFSAREGEAPAPHQQPQAAQAPAAAPPPAELSAPEPVPPFFTSEEAARLLPKTLAPGFFDHPKVAQAYRVAQQIPGVLAQQPCYCWCDKFGHGSLLDCFASNHGAG
jgi:hypothetical protein